MSSFGQTLRKAREAKGLTTSQVAAQTHILVQIVNDMENEDFHGIAAPIYGRGFVRLFAECVGLDPQPLIREFMDIYEGRRAPTVLVRDVPIAHAVAPTPVPPPDPEPVSPPSPIQEPTSAPDPAFDQMPSPESLSIPTAEPESVPLPDEGSVPLAETTLEPDLGAIPSPEPAPVPDAISEPEPAVLAETSVDELPDPIVDPFATPEPAPAIPTPIPEPPPVVRGLELFEQAAAAQSAQLAEPAQDPVPPPPSVSQPEFFSASQAPQVEQPTENPPSGTSSVPPAFDEAAFLPPSYEDAGPSAADRFRKGLSSVSHGVLQSVRSIPRSTWRIALLGIGAFAVIALIAFGCIKLYQATSNMPPTPGTEQPPAAKPDRPTSQPPPAQTSQKEKPPATQKPPKPAGTGKAADTQKSTSPTAMPQGRLRSTGQKIPPLYVD